MHVLKSTTGGTNLLLRVPQRVWHRVGLGVVLWPGFGGEFDQENSWSSGTPDLRVDGEMSMSVINIILSIDLIPHSHKRRGRV